MTHAALSNREWIAANPERRYRIVRRGDADQRGMVDATVVEIDADRRGWTTQDVLMRVELADTDEAAQRALGEYELILSSPRSIGMKAMLLLLRSPINIPKQ